MARSKFDDSVLFGDERGAYTGVLDELALSDEFFE